eukprot:8009660-Alexandrium_andersonii.AAC.1
MSNQEILDKVGSNQWFSQGHGFEGLDLAGPLSMCSPRLSLLSFRMAQLSLSSGVWGVSLLPAPA